MKKIMMIVKYIMAQAMLSVIVICGFGVTFWLAEKLCEVQWGNISDILWNVLEVIL